MDKEKDSAPKLVVEKDALIGEGAVWDADDELLYWVDILGHEVYVYDPVSGINRTISDVPSRGYGGQAEERWPSRGLAQWLCSH